jgi:hypothetical protein
MNLSYLVLAAGVAIGLLELHPSATGADAADTAPVKWPSEFEGRPLLPLPLSEMESAFAESFPGAIAHFQCGDDQIILRRVTRATRRLHSSATCLKAAGFRTGPATTELHEDGLWMTYTATRSGQALLVRERIRPINPSREAWLDVSQWFWHATFHPDRGPWMAVTVLRSERNSMPAGW